MKLRATAVALLAYLGSGIVSPGAAIAAPNQLADLVGARADGGSGTYTATGSTFVFELVNTGSTSWRYFDLLGPPNATFVGGATVGESTARCSTGQPNVPSNEIECGPLSLAGAAPSAQIGFVATMSSSLACGAPFELEVSSTGIPPYTDLGAVAFTGSCTASPATTTTTAVPAPAVAAPGCGAQQIAAAAARSTLDLLDQERAALEGPWRAGASAAAASAQYLARAEATNTPGGRSTGLVGLALTEARTADREAGSVLGILERPLLELTGSPSPAGAALSHANAALAACTRGGGSAAGAPAAADTECIDDRLMVARGQAALRVLGDARRRFLRTNAAAADKKLSAAARSLEAALAAASSPALGKEIRAALAGLGTTGAILAAGELHFDAFLSSSVAAARRLVTHDAARGSCTQK